MAKDSTKFEQEGYMKFVTYCRSQVARFAQAANCENRILTRSETNQYLTDRLEATNFDSRFDVLKKMHTMIMGVIKNLDDNLFIKLQVVSAKDTENMVRYIAEIYTLLEESFVVWKHNSQSYPFAELEDLESSFDGATERGCQFLDTYQELLKKEKITTSETRDCWNLLVRFGNNIGSIPNEKGVQRFFDLIN